MQTLPATQSSPDRHYEPSPRMRVFRLLFGLLLLSLVLAVGVARAGL